jgi:hypothetical protein
MIKHFLVKLNLKREALKLYFFFFNLRVKIKSTYRHIINPIKVSTQLKKGYLNIYLDSDWLGFGSRLIKTLELLNYASVNNVEFNIDYGYKDNLVESYFFKCFQPIKSHLFSKKKYIKIEDTSEVINGVDLNGLLDIKRANKILFETYKLNESVELELADFIDLHFRMSKVLGVHYRGTDKVGEAPRFEEDKLVFEIKKYLINDYFTKIFISTDEVVILERIKREFSYIPVVYRKDSFRSLDGNQFHRKMENPKDVINRDAIMNILILSNTDFLLKTSSIMSDCCFIFNPNLPYRILNSPHSSKLTWWPARELLKKQS